MSRAYLNMNTVVLLLEILTNDWRCQNHQCYKLSLRDDKKLRFIAIDATIAIVNFTKI